MPDTVHMDKATPVATMDNASARPKIVLTLHHGFSIRYIMQSGIFNTLRRAGADLVVLSLSDPEHLKAKFPADGVVFEQIPASVGERVQRRGRFQRVLRFIRAYTHARSVRTTDHTLDIALKDAALTNPSITARLNLLLLRSAIGIARRSKFLRRLIVSTESRLYTADEYTEFLKRHAPDLVVTTSLGTFDYDQYVLRAARHLGLQTAAVVLSWDNTTTRGYPGAVVDHVVAWSDIMKWELEALNDVPGEMIAVEGVAHFDDYFRPDPDYDRRTFLKELGLDPDKRTILVATKSPNCYAQNPNIADILAQAIETNELPDDCQILLRVHPLHYRFRDGECLYEEVLKVYHDLEARHPSLKLNEPDITSKAVNYDMATQEVLFLSRLLRSCDVLVNLFSTMNIEAAAFDVPMVNVNFDDLPPMYPCVRGHRFDIRIDFESDHNQRIVKSGGTRIAQTPAELVRDVHRYLDDPALDADGRKKIVENEIGVNRGHASAAIAERMYGWAADSHARRLSA